MPKLREYVLDEGDGREHLRCRGVCPNAARYNQDIEILGRIGECVCGHDGLCEVKPGGSCKASDGGLVETGSSVQAMTESEMPCLMASVLRISSGPNASSAL